MPVTSLKFTLLALRLLVRGSSKFNYYRRFDFRHAIADVFVVFHIRKFNVSKAAADSFVW